MHFVESMSLFSGLKSTKPFIEETFFPVAFDKYITISSENHQSKQWDHFQEYINLINPILKKNNITIVEIGNNQVGLNNIAILKNITNQNHWSFIIKNSLLHIGPESFISSLAAYHNIPCISLFSNTSPEYASTSWIQDSPSNQIPVLPEIEKHKPSFSAQEPVKTINTISAESIAAKTLDFLKIEHEFSKYEVFNTGRLYHNTIIEVVPDFIPQQNFFPRSLINLRLDYHYNLDSLMHFASERKLAIVSDQEIDTNVLMRIKPNVQNLFFKIDESSNVDYYSDLKRKGFAVQLLAKETADLSETRFKFFDWGVAEENSNKKKSLDNFEKICDTTRYKSSKMIFSKDGQFSSKSSFNKGIKTYEDQIIIDDDEFWNEADHYKLYNLK
jgi:hypothetical protein